MVAIASLLAPRKALEIAFEKDKGFAEWLKSHTTETFKLSPPKTAESGRINHLFVA